MDSFLSSSQNFVRALKGSSGPPIPGGPSKIDIARSAWDQKSFYAPRKSEVIVDLILNLFLKTGETHSVTDIKSWQLLLEVISPSQSASNDSWLVPLVSRIPFPRIVIQLFESLQKSSAGPLSPLTTISNQCITILWSFCVSKVNTDVLLECFGASLRLIKTWKPDEDCDHMITTVVGSFQRSLSASTTKKKIFSAFVQNHLAVWLSSMDQLLSSPSHSALLECIYTSGAECLLNLDVLRDSKCEAALFSAFENIASETIMPSMPRLFSSYIQTLRKNRGAIFGQGSSHKLDSLEEFRESALRIFSLYQPILNKATNKGEAWRTMTRLLDVINQENLFSARHVQSERLLNGIVNSALIEIGAEHSDTLAPAISCLCSLIRVDYRFVESVLPDILSNLLLVPNTVAPAMELLDIILQYHIKTRTVTLYIDTLMSIDFAEGIRGDCQTIYSRIFRSAGLHPIHLDQLGKCTREFLPSNQTFVALRSATERITSLWEAYQLRLPTGEGQSARKRRKSNSGSGNDDLTNATALTLSVTAAFAAVILSSFSTESVPKESQEELGTLLNDFSAKVVLHSLSKTFKDITKKTEHSSWAEEVAILANLRIRYALGLQHSRGLSIEIECPSKLIRRMLESVESFALPELRLEIMRTSFKSMPEGQQLAILDMALNILETTDMSSGFGMLRMVIQRWLPLIDSQASTTQLERFVGFLMKLQYDEIFAGIQLGQSLFSAEFWELRNIRTALLAFIDQTISVIDDWASATLTQQQLVYSVFQTLLYVPSDYLTRPLRNSLVKRAISLDQTVTASTDLQLLRAVIAHISVDYSETPYVDLPLYLQYLHQSHDITSETMELIGLLLRTLLKSGNSDKVLQLLKCYTENLQAISFSTSTSWTRSFNILVEFLLKEHTLKSFSVSTQDAFKTLFDALRNRILPTLVDLISSPSPSKLTQRKGLLEGWLIVLKLGRWLGFSQVDPVLGERVAKLFAYTDKAHGTTDISFVVFGVLLEEFNFCDTSVRDQRLEIVIAAYVLLAMNRTITSLEVIDQSISSISPTLSPETFKHALGLILDSLRCAHEGEVKALLHLLTNLLQDSPQNTFHIVQSTVTESINIFNDRNVFVEGARLSALQLLSQRCRDRPATLRQLDVSGIWLLIAKICAGSEAHDPTTSVETFHCIVSITTALVRLRRDLVLLTIPHLGMILRRLIQSMQTPRPNIGPKQGALVSRSLPSWINTQEPLGVQESKALSRLFESLNTKTVVKKLNVTTTAAAPKAESLGKPFSKHSAYVIKAYVESLNNPFCVLPAAVRKELQPGLYALCGLLNEYSRDALMASATDAGEKAVLKALWREYEQQRYVGRG